MDGRTGGSRIQFLGAIGIVVAFEFVAGQAIAAEPAYQAEFDEHIQPILAKHCASCHRADKSSSDLDLSSIDSILQGGASGAVMAPGKSSESLILQLVREEGVPHMPPKGQLSQLEISLLRRWIDSIPPATKAAATKKTPVANDSWAFTAPRKPSLPPMPASHHGWTRTPIDAFVAVEHAKRGLTPAKPASKLALIRRATFDLTGLPPTEDEVKAFLADDREHAYERLIDRLLASPRYGERWGRHWLDLARYADSDGYEWDVDRPFAFPYRDYVIRSFNDDLPYDEFLSEQIAADEMVQEVESPRLAALGFCRAGPIIDNQKNEKNRLDELDDVISTTSSVFLGLSVGCARCHDHKYDPISQKDYYRFLAIFNNAEKTTACVGTPEENAAYQAKIAVYNDEMLPFRIELDDLTWKIKFPGEWTEKGAALVQSQPAPGARLYFGDPKWYDYVFECEVEATAGTGGFNVAARATDEDNAIWMQLFVDVGKGQREHRAVMQRAGVDKIVFSKPAPAVQMKRNYKLRITAHGDLVKAEIDGVPVLEYEDDRYRQGAVAIGGDNTAQVWRNLRVGSIDGKATSFSGVPGLGLLQEMTADELAAHKARRKELNETIAELEKREPKPPCALAIGETTSKAKPTYLLHRGDHRNQGPEVEPGVPEALSALSFAIAEPGPNAKSSGRRAALATWLTSPHHPLTARVMVNRVWQHHFGRGIVATPSDFGKNGSPPTHPDLLDWLAIDFVDNGWKLKRLHKLIMTSATYMQSSERESATTKSDLDVTYLSRFPFRRLSAEEIRDSILQSSGSLNLSMYGPGVRPRVHPAIIASGSKPKWPIVDQENSEHWRRTVYVFVKRSVTLPLVEGFDGPTASQSCPVRLATVVPTQALQLMNDAFTNEQADCLAQLVLREAGNGINEQADCVYWLTLSRSPTAAEKTEAAAFLNQQRNYHRQRQQVQLVGTGESKSVMAAAIADFGLVMMNASEFLYVD